MPLVPMRSLLDHAAENNYGVAAFNVNNMEQIQAIMEAAEKTESPVIIQASRGRPEVHQRRLPAAPHAGRRGAAPQHPHRHAPGPRQLARNLLERHQAGLHLGDDGRLADGRTARPPPPTSTTCEVTRQVVEAAHAKGVTVEGELGCLGGIEDGHGAGLTGEEARKHLTDPAQAEQFVAETGVDALAVAIGTSHGAYKFKHKPTGDVLVMDVIEEIHRRLPNTHLVMHGSSSVPEELLDIIRMYGGYMKETYGVPVEEIQRGIQHGVRKINVDTDNRLAMTGAIRKAFPERPFGV